MAEFFQTFGAVDLALGKPGIHSLPVSSTVGDALRMLRETGLAEISVWDWSSATVVASIDRSQQQQQRKWECREFHCLGKVNLLDIICYYASADKVHKIEAASRDPVSVLLSPAKKNQIRHLDLRSSLVLDGAQSFLVPLNTRRTKSVKVASVARKSVATVVEKYQKMEFCWLTHEDVLRFMLGCIGVFSPVPMMSIQDLGIIDRDVMFVDANSKASDALPLMIQASHKMSAVAVVEQEHEHEQEELGEAEEDVRLKLVGDISLASLGNCCDETAALALASLSIADFMTFIQDTAGAPQPLKELILSGLEVDGTETETDASKPTKKRGLSYERIKLGMVDSSSSDTDSSSTTSSDSSSDDETASTGSMSRSGRRAAKFQAGPCPSSSPLCCHPWSSLVAVMAQALAFRRTYLWVTDDDHTLIGMVTYLDMIRILLKHI